MPISCMQQLTDCFTFQIQEERNTLKIESKDTGEHRNSRTTKVGTTYMAQRSLQFLKERTLLSYSASRHFES
jgi:hypothetical protein